jgi:hypothetical protein
VPVNDPSADREPDAHSFTGVVQAMEEIEDVLPVLLLDSDPVVLDREKPPFNGDVPCDSTADTLSETEVRPAKYV